MFGNSGAIHSLVWSPSVASAGRKKHSSAYYWLIIDLRSTTPAMLEFIFKVMELDVPLGQKSYKRPNSNNDMGRKFSTFRVQLASSKTLKEIWQKLCRLKKFFCRKEYKNNFQVARNISQIKELLESFRSVLLKNLFDDEFL